MRFNEITESTTSGSIATVAAPMSTQKRSSVGKGVYGNEKAGNLLTGKKTSKKYANSVNESKMKELADDLKNMDNGNFQKKYNRSKEQMKAISGGETAKKAVREAHLEEDDLIIIPGQGHRLKSGFIPHGQSRLDHEVEMARSDLYSAAKNAKTIHGLIKDLSEEQGLEGWVQEKIIKANDYLNSVREYLEGKRMHEMQGGVIAGGGVGESVEELDENLRDWFKEKWVRFGPDGKIRGACARGDDSEGKPKCLPQKKAHNLGKEGRKYAASKKRREDPNPERSGPAKNVATKKKSNEDIQVDEVWSQKYKDSINCSNPKGFSQKAHCAGKKKTNESIPFNQCPDCRGPIVHESMMNEKKDACYHKVKARYKVWPSAYASGALVKCRKKGASNWGKSKTNEGIASAGGKMTGKVLPGLGAALSAQDAYKRQQAGDTTGAVISGLSGAASLVPGVGTAGSLAGAGIQATRDKVRTGSWFPSQQEIAAVSNESSHDWEQIDADNLKLRNAARIRHMIEYSADKFFNGDYDMASDFANSQYGKLHNDYMEDFMDQYEMYDMGVPVDELKRETDNNIDVIAKAYLDGRASRKPATHAPFANLKSTAKGVAEGWGFDKWGHDIWTDAQKEVARKKKNEKQRTQRQQKSKEQGVAEGAKVDRMVKHIAKSERSLGKSKDEAEDIAWATANKRGYLDNKNKKKGK